MTKFGIDCVAAPSAYQAKRIASAGYTFCCVYVGGPYATPGNKHGWPGASIAAIAPSFTDGFLPLYVGQQDVPGNPNLSGGTMTYEQGRHDGLEANQFTDECGFSTTSPLGLDLEAGNLQADPTGVREYVRGWVESVNAAGHPAGLYADIYTIAHLGTSDLIDWTFPASWHWTVPRWLGTYPDPQAGAHAADPVQPPASTLWQFASGGSLAGVSVDLDSAIDSFQMATL